MQCRIVKLKDMNNRLHTYFDRTRLERIDYFRQLIFLAFTSLSIVLFGLHLVGSYGLAIKSALACSASYVLAAVVALIVYLFQGPKKLKHILPVLLVTLMIIQSVRLLILASMGQHNAMLTTVNITACFILVLVACLCLLPRTALVCTVISVVAMALCCRVTGSQLYSQLVHHLRHVKCLCHSLYLRGQQAVDRAANGAGRSCPHHRPGTACV